MWNLKSALLLNGISSGITGAGLVILAGPTARLFETSDKLPFVYTGIFLIAFALLVVRTAFSKKLNSTSLMVISTLDLAWIAGSIGLVIVAGTAISMVGNVLIIAVAAWVGLMAVLQSKLQKKYPGIRQQTSVA